MDTVECPGCGRPMTRVAYHGVHHQCGACGGRLIGLVPFQEELVRIDAARIWRASETGAPTGRCPFCSGAMHAPDGEVGTGGLAVCRRCEQVWVPKTAEPWMDAHAAPRPSDESRPRQSHAETCANCGAPFSPDEDGRCHYCRAELVDSEPVVVIFQP